MILEVIGLTIIAFGVLFSLIGLFTHGPVYHNKRRGASLPPQQSKPNAQEGKNVTASNR